MTAFLKAALKREELALGSERIIDRIREARMPAEAWDAMAPDEEISGSVDLELIEKFCGEFLGEAGE